ncbi:MAG: RDD family protein, partial [Candidatus Nitrosopolaris sp.]
LNLAKWNDRFFAWFIDFIIVTVGIEIIFYAATFPLWFDYNPARWFSNGNGATSVGYITRSLIFLAYWTYFESTSGQSIGKKLLQIKTIGISGEALSILDALIESFGKSFLLPLDVLLGWIFTNDRRQRISNRASNTIIIKLKSQREDLKSNNQVRYTKD